jgi:hypothetical protein
VVLFYLFIYGLSKDAIGISDYVLQCGNAECLETKGPARLRKLMLLVYGMGGAWCAYGEEEGL